MVDILLMSVLFLLLNPRTLPVSSFNFASLSLYIFVQFYFGLLIFLVECAEDLDLNNWRNYVGDKKAKC